MLLVKIIKKTSKIVLFTNIHDIYEDAKMSKKWIYNNYKNVVNKLFFPFQILFLYHGYDFTSIFKWMAKTVKKTLLLKLKKDIKIFEKNRLHNFHIFDYWEKCIWKKMKKIESLEVFVEKSYNRHY